MPDITMCEGGDCPMKEKCYRFNAEPNPYRQSYFITPPFSDKSGKCFYYWDRENHAAMENESQTERGNNFE